MLLAQARANIEERRRAEEKREIEREIESFQIRKYYEDHRIEWKMIWATTALTHAVSFSGFNLVTMTFMYPPVAIASGAFHVITGLATSASRNRAIGWVGATIVPFLPWILIAIASHFFKNRL